MKELTINQLHKISDVEVALRKARGTRTRGAVYPLKLKLKAVKCISLLRRYGHNWQECEASLGVDSRTLRVWMMVK